MLVWSIFFAAGSQPVACGLKHELKHLKKYGSINFEYSFEIRVYEVD